MGFLYSSLHKSHCNESTSCRNSKSKKTKKPESNYNYLNYLKRDSNINLEADWDIVIDEWDKLLSNEQLDDEFDSETNEESDFYDSEIHLAENQAAKW
ncbi:42132_t:CDS:2, partial [Gigaspora margarita]